MNHPAGSRRNRVNGGDLVTKSPEAKNSTNLHFFAVIPACLKKIG